MVEEAVGTLLPVDLAGFDVRLEHVVGDHVHRHEFCGFLRFGVRVGASEHIESAVDFLALKIVQVIVQKLQIGFIEFAGGEIRAELELVVELLLLRQFDDRLAVLLLEPRVLDQCAHFDLAVKLADRAVAVGIHERCGQMADERRVTAAFGNLRLAHVVHHVKVVVRHFPDEHVRPVIAGERDLLPRREFQASVGAEMNQRIRVELVPDPEIGCDVVVRRSHFDAVHDLVRIRSLSGDGLRHQHDVSEAEHTERKSAVRRLEGFPRKFPVARRHRPIEIRGHALSDPGFILFPGDLFHLRLFHEFLRRALGIGAENRGVVLNLPEQLFGRFRKFACVEPGLPQVPEKVQQRVADLDSSGGQGVFPVSLVVDDRHFLVGVFPAAHCRDLACEFGEAFDAVGNRLIGQQSAFIAEKRRKDKRRDAAVDFRHGHALAEHASVHSALILEIDLVRLIALDRAEERNVVLRKDLHRAFRVARSEPSVRLIDDEIGFRLPDHFRQASHSVDGHDVEFAFFQRFDESAEIAAAVAGVEQNRGGFRVMPSDRLVVIQIFPVGHESGFLVDVKENGARHDFDRFDFVDPQEFAVHVAADVVQHVAEILLSGIPHVVADGFPLLLRHGVFRGFVVRCRGEIDRFFQGIQKCALAFGNVSAHAEEENHVIVAQFVAGFRFPRKHGDFDGRIERLVEFLRKQIFRIVHKCDSCRRGVFLISPYSEADQKQCSGKSGDADSYFRWHGIVPSFSGTG